MFSPRAKGDYWFRLGRMEVTSTLLVIFLGVIGMIVCAISPTLFSFAFFTTESFLGGEFWRLVTWPFANGVSIWTLLMFLMLWFFGTSVESNLGRNNMLRLYLEIWGALTAATFLVGLVLPGSTGLAGLNQVQFVILLLWIAEYPTRKFFFSIPAWVLGVFFVALNVLQLLAAGAWGGIVAMFLSFLLVAFAARRIGLLGAYDFLPGNPRKRSNRSRSASPRAKAKRERQQQRNLSDEDRMDQLLAKISAEGIHSLSNKERVELERLRQRRQRR